MYLSVTTFFSTQTPNMGELGGEGGGIGYCDWESILIDRFFQNAYNLKDNKVATVRLSQSLNECTTHLDVFMMHCVGEYQYTMTTYMINSKQAFTRLHFVCLSIILNKNNSLKLRWWKKILKLNYCNFFIDNHIITTTWIFNIVLKKLSFLYFRYASSRLRLMS